MDLYFSKFRNPHKSYPSFRAVSSGSLISALWGLLGLLCFWWNWKSALVITMILMVWLYISHLREIFHLDLDLSDDNELLVEIHQDLWQ